MKNLKNIRHFEEFKDAMNEELLWGAVKNLLSTIFGKMDKKFADSINNFTQKIDGTKNWEESIKLTEQANGDVKNKMTEGLKTVTGPLGLRKLLVDTSNTIFTELMVLFNRYGKKEASPRKIFEGTPNAQMFAFDKAKDFESNLYNALNAKIIEMNKGQNGQTPAYDEKELQKYLTDQKDINSVDPQQPDAKPNPNAATPGATSATTSGVTPGATSAKNDSAIYSFTDKLNELATNAPPNGTIANLTAPATAWVNELLGGSLKKLQGIKPPSKIGQEDAFTAISKNTKVTQNKESMAKLLRGITNLPEDKKPDVIQIRDILGKATGRSPDEIKNDMPL